MPKLSQSIHDYLQFTATKYSKDLVDRWSVGMETQINVSAGKGCPVEGKRSTYSDGIDTWWNIRIPKGAADEPTFSDYEMRWPLDLHAEGIGMTGWNWQEKRSKWVGFDFDSITTHAKGVGVSDEQLEEVRKAASLIPWVEVRRSTGGKGLHLYVHLDVPTANHTEHAALARAVLGLLSQAAGFDFASQIDCCGAILWVWHKKLTGKGLELLKEAECDLVAVPSNWRDHVAVVTRKRAKVKVKGVDENSLETLAAGRENNPLDEIHKRTIDLLLESGYSTVWVDDYHLLQTHTKALEQIAPHILTPDACIYATTSEGKDRGTCNCFAFPLIRGGWKVFRFTPGCSEAETWTQDSKGWTTCYFNRPADLKMAAKIAGGADIVDGFSFQSGADAEKAVSMMGQTLVVPAALRTREISLHPLKDGRVIAKVKKASPKEMPPSGWGSQGTCLINVLDLMASPLGNEECSKYDHCVRTLVSPTGSAVGWKSLTRDGVWCERPKDDVKNVLRVHGATTKEAIEFALGESVLEPWKLVVLPFQPEYPGGRQWNCNAAKFSVVPVPGQHPNWDAILSHCFHELDEPIAAHEYCQKVGIKNGADYGLLWAANMFRNPFEPLPYLFFYGDENCGKSTFHEALALLMTTGTASADRALKSLSDFNGELAGTVLAYIEENDLSKTAGAMNKIKDWTTSPVLWVRRMRTDSYSLPNTLHFVQAANSSSNCPVLPGDTRITMIHVGPLEVEIPKGVLMRALKDEAPAFLYTLLQADLPTPNGRLLLPVIETDGKSLVQDEHRPALQTFLAETCSEVPGSVLPFNEIYLGFRDWLRNGDGDQEKWTKTRVAREFPVIYPRGYKGKTNSTYVGNIAWNTDIPEPGKRLVKYKARLCEEGSNETCQ